VSLTHDRLQTSSDLPTSCVYQLSVTVSASRRSPSRLRLAIDAAMPRRRATASPKAHDDDQTTNDVAAAEQQKSRRDAAVTAEPHVDMPRKAAVNLSQHRSPDAAGNQWSLRQALKLFQTGERSSARRRRTAADDNSSLSSERSAKTSNSGTSSSSSSVGFPTAKGHQRQEQYRVKPPPQDRVKPPHDRVKAEAPPTERAQQVRSQAEPRDSPAGVTAAAAPPEPNAGVGGGAEKRSASSGSSRMSISSSGSQAQAPSATARATKRPGRTSADVNPTSDKKHSRNGGTEAAAEVAVVDPPQGKSPSASHLARSQAAATGVERRSAAAANEKESLMAARPMDRHERVQRYLAQSNMLPLPAANLDQDQQQSSRRHRRHKRSSRTSDSVHDAPRKSTATTPVNPRRERSNSDNEFDRKQEDAKEDVGGKRQGRRPDGDRSAKTRRNRSPTDRVKYSFPPFDEPNFEEKKRKRRKRTRYESLSSSGSSSSKSSASENATPPPPPVQRAHRKRNDEVQRRHRRRQRTDSQSSSGGSSRSGQARDGRRQIAAALAVARSGSVDSVMPSRTKQSKSIERNAPAAYNHTERFPDEHGRRSRNQGRLAQASEARSDENDNTLLINEADKDQWRKYFADLYTFNMLQKMKSAKKRKKKRHEDDMDIDDDDRDVERPNTFHPAPPEAIHGDSKPIGLDGAGYPPTAADTYQTMNYDHRVPFGNGPVSGAMPPETSPASRVPHPTSHYDGEVADYKSWPPGLAAKQGVAGPGIDELTGRQTLLPLPSEPVPLFALNLSGVMSSVSRLYVVNYYHRRRRHLHHHLSVYIPVYNTQK